MVGLKSDSVAEITNIAAYKFARLDGLKDKRAELLRLCKSQQLKGTILLAPEGINLFIAGAATSVASLLEALRGYPGLEDLTPKFSISEHQPFSRMLVRLKKEIIAFGMPGIDPARYTSPRVDAKTLKSWLDQGKPVVLLDTRNDYEIKLGTFAGALPAGIDHFRDFPKSVAALDPALKDTPIVTFCTGGIRCEKAAPYMEQQGFRQVFQLDGGILKYFEEVGSDHYSGECFVFDQRVGVDPALEETGSVVCFACQTPLSAEEKEDPRYQEQISCPYCYKSDTEKLELARLQLENTIRRVVQPLPGAQPADNRRPIRVPAACDGMSVIEMLHTILGHIPDDEWLALIAAGRVLSPSGLPVAPDHCVRSGEEYVRLFPMAIEPEVHANVRVLHYDEALLVVDKPAPLPVHACGRYHRNTLQHILHLACNPEHPRPVHRLDANTSGVLVCARTRHFSKLLHPQFERGEVQKEYLARVHGHPATDHFTVEAPISQETSALGARRVDLVSGLAACTDFSVRRRDADGTAVLVARPITGRTNQIRVHLWHIGHPIVGDPCYLLNHQFGDGQTLPMSAPPMCLHAQNITLRHPISQELCRYSAPDPVWAE